MFTRRTRRTLVLWAALTAAGPGVLIGSRAEPLVLTESSCAEKVLRTNPELHAARMTVDEAEARFRGAGRLSNPEFDSTLAGGPDGEGRLEFGLSQRFPLTARLRWEKQRSLMDLDLARAEIATREQSIALAAQEAFLQFLASRAALALAKENYRVGKEFQQSLEKRAAEGLASRLEADEASLEVFHLEAKCAEAQAEETEWTARLTALLGLPPSTQIVGRGDLKLPETLPSPRPHGERPELRLARLAAEAGNVDIALAAASRWEDIGLGLFIESEWNRDEPVGIQQEGFLGLRLSIPLPVWQNGQPKVAEKQAARARLLETVKALEAAARHDTESRYRLLKLRYETARRLDTVVLPAARRYLAANQSAFDRGEIPAEKIFRAREQLAEWEAIALNARTTYHLARLHWTASLGEIELHDR